ncbi:MAG TPA: 1,4-dihydroxy-2-naphthoate polyprenyltransferase, partial [Opitutaceae bacterium]|nr:1,4-dihydroxy-2-naphthoate polyprenyltransferase [Opitutaceae bacterium]
GVVPFVFAFHDRRPWPLLPVLLTPVAIAHYRKLSASKSPQELIALLGATGKLLAGYAVLLTVGLVLARIR